MASSSAPIPFTSAAASSASSTMSSSSPCAACKFLRRKCQPDCVFAPYFPPDNQQKFVNVHRVFGASNVTKLLNDLQPYQREDAVNSLAYEADMRLRDPVYGCVGVISILQHQLRQLQADLSRAKFELSQYQSSTTPAPAATVVNGFININHHPIGMGAGFGFGREQFFPTQVRDPQQAHMVMKNYDAELIAKLGVNGGCDAGLMAAMNASAASIGSLGGPFLKSSSAGGAERPSFGPS